MSESKTSKILVVDDEEAICTLLTQILKDYQVYSAENPQQAMEVVATHDIDIIITDIKMPVASGFEMGELAELYDVDIPLIVISGHVAEENVKSRMERETEPQYIAKPFSKNQILEAVEKCLSEAPKEQENPAVS